MSQTEEMESINLKLSLLKTQLFSTISTCDRGFGATTNDRQSVLKVVDEMKQLCQESCPTRGLYPYNNFNETETNTTGNTGILESTPELTIPVPIDGVWKMAFTNAYDVVSLAANPLSQIQGIYQVIDRSGASANIIDFSPRVQTLLPTVLADKISSQTRAIVYTSSYARTCTRVGLQFKKVELKQNSLFGFTVPKMIPSLKISIPSLGPFGPNEKNTPVDRSGFFDIVYLDNDLLIIQQNQPGGIFINVRDTSEYGNTLKSIALLGSSK